MRLSRTDDAIMAIYRETIDDFYGVVSSRCDGDRDLAEDVVQETWLRALKDWRARGIPDRPIAWLTTVATRILANHFRRGRTDSLGDDTALAARDEIGAAERTERRSIVERALARLPALQTRLLEAFHFDRRSVSELAREHELSERAIEGRLRRARQSLRKQIETENRGE